MNKLIKVLLLTLFLHTLYNVHLTSVSAAPPAKREEIILNGTWDFTPTGGARTTIQVPKAWDAETQFQGVSSASYEKQIAIPINWSGRRIKIEFDGVNHITTVFVNGIKVIDNHLGGWIPFSADITNNVTAGSTATIKVDVKGGNSQPIVDANGYPAWPVGWHGHGQQWGIIFDVALRAYGPINIQNTFVKTSVQNKTLTTDYVLENTTGQTQIVNLSATVSKNNINEISIPAQAVTIPPLSTVTKSVIQLWENPSLWSPKTPNLYLLRTVLTQNGQTMDTETIRFGFREITKSGNQLYLNGIRLNLRGDSMNEHSQGFHDNYVKIETWPSVVDKLLARNINVLRPHQQPAPKFVIDTADEKGLLIIEESPIYARDYLRNSNKALYLQNSLVWIKDWVIDRRNHPSIIRWNVENEIGYGTGYINWFTNQELIQLGNRVREFDTTRHIGYDGDKEVGDALYDQHYPEGYNASWSGSIYRYSPNTSKPHGIGEFLTDYGPSANRWWQGTASRGLRYKNFSDIRPYTLFWTWDKTLSDPQVKNLKNSFAPIALFDYGYDDLGIAPLLGSLPSLIEGQTVTRELVLYNDDFSDTSITIKVEALVGSTIYATGSRINSLTLGEHIKFPYTFQVPNQGGNTLTLRLSTMKQGQTTFSEDIKFMITEAGLSGSTNSNIAINWQGSQTPSPTIFGDLNNDGHVNMTDYNLVVSQFGNPYTIYDYNNVVSNYGS